MPLIYHLLDASLCISYYLGVICSVMEFGNHCFFVLFFYKQLHLGHFYKEIKGKMTNRDLREQSLWWKTENTLGFRCETLVFTEALPLVCGTYPGDVSRWSQLICSDNKHFTFINLRVTSLNEGSSKTFV